MEHEHALGRDDQNHGTTTKRLDSYARVPWREGIKELGRFRLWIEVKPTVPRGEKGRQPGYILGRNYVVRLWKRLNALFQGRVRYGLDEACRQDAPRDCGRCKLGTVNRPNGSPVSCISRASIPTRSLGTVSVRSRGGSHGGGGIGNSAACGGDGC
ncbi:hypothetical protein BJX61DRAFT_517524 [Aspergillus egyptiacus]|nr:hypothetical protein BJX61DRAFT_517524 [Aspergillus egyptiacus]